MKLYKTIDVKNYCIERIECKCRNCNENFVEFVPDYEDLVQFDCDDNNIRYLPTYGMNGYLELMSRLIDGWTKNDSITELVVRKFESQLSLICPYEVKLKKAFICPYCFSKNVTFTKNEILHNPPVKWIEIDSDYMK